MNPDFQTKAFTFMVRMWLVATLLSAVCSGYFIVMRDRWSAVFFFGLFLFSAVQYFMRRRQRKKHMEYLAYKEEQEKKK